MGETSNLNERLERVQQLRAQVQEERQELAREQRALRLSQEQLLAALSFQSGTHEINSEMAGMNYTLNRLKKMLVRSGPATREVEGAISGLGRLRSLAYRYYLLSHKDYLVKVPGLQAASWLRGHHSHELNVCGIDLDFSEGFMDTDFSVAPRTFLIVLSFLVRNSIRALRRQDEKRVVVSLGDSANFDLVSVRVQDTGPGIKPERWESVFLPYYTGSSSSAEMPGHGLYLARICAERLSGDRGMPLRVVDSDGGAAFEFDVRLCQDSGST